MDLSACTGIYKGEDTGVVTISGITCIIPKLLTIIPPLLLFIAVLFLIFAGAQMILAGADQKKLGQAQQTLTYAIVGVVGIGLSWVVLVLIQNLTGANVTEINFGN